MHHQAFKPKKTVIQTKQEVNEGTPSTVLTTENLHLIPESKEISSGFFSEDDESQNLSESSFKVNHDYSASTKEDTRGTNGQKSRSVLNDSYLCETA